MSVIFCFVILLAGIVYTLDCEFQFGGI